MGNAASVDPSDSDLDKMVDVKVSRKSGEGETGINRIADQMARKEKAKKMRQNNNNEPNFADDINAIANASHGSPAKPNNSQPSFDGDDEGDEDSSPVEVLLQFIPYYGQGDPSNDSIVRATLSGLSIDDIDSKDEYGNTLLLLACQYKCDDLVRIMLGKGADPNAINSSGACCLHFACYRESASYNSARLLLQNGANPEVSELTYGCTPLHYCAGTGQIDFCKLLLSHGAEVATMDYYNYTCADYAREAGMHDVAGFLQGRLDKAAQLTSQRTLNSPGGGSSANLLAGMQDNSWVQHVDPQTSGKYYMNADTGETLWENDYLTRIQSMGHNQANNSPGLRLALSPSAAAGIAFGGGGGVGGVNVRKSMQLVDNDGEDEEDEEVNGVDPHVAEAWLVTQTSRARLIGFLGKNDPIRLAEVENLLDNYKGREEQMLRELCQKYEVNEEEELKAFQDKLVEMKAQSKGGGGSGGGGGLSVSTTLDNSSNNSSNSNSKKGSGGISTDFKLGQSTPVAARGGGAIPSTPGSVGGMDPSMVQTLINEARLKFEQQLEEQKKESRTVLAEKVGALVKLQGELDSLKRGHTSMETEKTQLLAKLDRTSAQGGEATKQLEQELCSLQDDNATLKDNLSRTKQSLDEEVEKANGLDSSLKNLSAGKEEAVERERQQADERARAAREKEDSHRAELGAVEDKFKENEKKMKTKMDTDKLDFITQERELRAINESQRKIQESTILTLETEIAEKKAKMTQDLSEANMRAADSQKFAEETCKRADAAEAIQATMQQEVLEARQIQSYNSQLHKDLSREQLARKRLHNEMEDMKGRIRVYVRVRPFSKSEIERGCHEACYKDGKLSVQVTGIGDANAKKTYDFDQVFGGKDGNTQKDVFRDTKHLIMSVIDGYNVCIFAYGQTGAGKSFTMIGAADIGNCLSEEGEFDDLAGITPRAVSELFRLLNERQAQVEYNIEVQMFQLYRDGLDDLLTEKKKGKKGGNNEEEKQVPMKITLAEHSPTGLVQVEGAVSMAAETPGEVMKIFAKGSSRRATASTQMNAESSRSHLICCLVVKLKNRRTKVESVGKLTLVDLAGSERVDKSGAQGEMLKEAQSINKSLSALGDVIAGLTSGSKHVPYRNHPLTMLMSDSLGGNAKTLMFVNTSPADYNNAESNSSLGFASRCKDITNSVQAGPGVQAAQMNALKKQLAQMKKGGKKGGKSLARPDDK